MIPSKKTIWQALSLQDLMNAGSAGSIAAQDPRWSQDFNTNHLDPDVLSPDPSRGREGSIHSTDKWRPECFREDSSLRYPFWLF
jgi:hypothetical protein